MRPLPVIDPRMLGQVRPVSEGAMLDRIEFREPGGEPAVSADGLTSTSPAGPVRYSGRCRIVPLQEDARVREVAERPVTFRLYRVDVPWDTPGIEVDYVGVVKASAGDPELPGRALRVVDFVASSLLVERSLVCEEVVD